MLSVLEHDHHQHCLVFISVQNKIKLTHILNHPDILFLEHLKANFISLIIYLLYWILYKYAKGETVQEKNSCPFIDFFLYTRQK